MSSEPGEKHFEQLAERFRREAQGKREETIGRIVYNLIQIYGNVSYETIHKELVRKMADSPSERGEIRPELDVQRFDAVEAYFLLQNLHEPHDG